MSAALELTVLGEIAKGGMGSVELARLEDATGEHFVAVKRMHREYASDPEFVRMFRDEIWLMAALSHPNLVGLVGWGEDDEGPYLAMEYVDGVALGRIVNAGRRAFDPIAEKLVAFVAARSAEGLAAAHRLHDKQGEPLHIVHRDVTPSNVMVAFDGSVKVTDFGIAKAAGKSSHTRTGIIKGKVAYMSPEYAARRPVDGRSDLYSLGVVMFEMITGVLPFSARTDFELLKLVAYTQAPAVASASPDVDPALARIVDGLLAKDPAARPADGDALARTLDDWLEDQGHDPDEVVRDLIAYAEKHAGPKRDFLKKLTDDDIDTEPDDGSGLARPRIAMLGTRTFTFFDKPWAHEESKANATEPERPGTRRVAVSEFPPPSVPVSLPPVPRMPARGSVPPPPPSVAAELQRPAHASTVRKRPPHSAAALGGVGVGIAVAVVLVLASVAARRSAPEPADVEPSAPPPSASITTLPATALPVPMTALPVPAVTEAPAASAPVAESVTEPALRPDPVSSATAPRPTVTKHPVGKGPKKPTKPCTIDSFDYPACLSR